MRHYWGCMLCARFVWVKTVANFFLVLPLAGANGSLYGVNGSLGENADVAQRNVWTGAYARVVLKVRERTGQWLKLK